MKRLLFFLLLFWLFYFKGAAQQPVIDSLHHIITLGKSDKEQVLAMNKLAGELLRTDVEKAKSILHQAISLSKDLKNARALSNSYSIFVTLFQNTGKPDSSVYYLALLQKLSEEANGQDTDIIRENYNHTAGLFYKKSGNPKRALPYLQKAVFFAKKNGDKVAIAGNLLNLGNTYRALADYKNALVYHLESLKYFEEAGNKRGQSFCYQSISNSFAELKQYKKALKYSKKSILLKKELGDKRGLGTSQDGLGNIYMGLGEYNKALQHFEASLVIAKDLNLVTEQAKIYFNIGKVYAKKNDVEAALLNFNLCKKLSGQLGDNAASSAADIEIIALQKNEDLPDAETKIISSLHTFTLTGDRTKEAAGYKNLAEFYLDNKQYEKALAYTNKYYLLNDSIQNNELQLQFKKIEEQYIIEKKENEITILKKDQQLNEAIIEKQKAFKYGAVLFLALTLLTAFLIINRYRVMQRAKRQIEIEKMRNNIARDLHDDIGSTLTSINILSKVMLLENETKETGMQTKLLKIKEHSAAIMESMSDIVWAINPKNNTIEKVIFRMKEFAAEILEPHNIGFHFETKGNMAAVKLDPEKRKDLFLIFKEVINNAAKYSQCSHINIMIQNNGKNLQLKITDDGKGFDEAGARKGNGIFNIRERAKEMAALLQYHTMIDKGTTVSLNVPFT